MAKRRYASRFLTSVGKWTNLLSTKHSLKMGELKILDILIKSFASRF